MNELSVSNCSICFASVSRDLMPLHRDWHVAEVRHRLAPSAVPRAETELDELLRLVASLRRIPEVSASPEFLGQLRDQLTAEVFAMAAHEKGTNEFADDGR